MESKEKEISKTTDKKNSERIKEKLMEKEFKKYLEEQLKNPTEFALSLIEGWRKRISLPFNLSERLKNKSKPFPNKEEEEKIMKAMVEFFGEVLKFEEIQRKVEKEFLKPPPPQLPEKKEKEKLKRKFMSPKEIEDSFQMLLRKKEIIADPKFIKDIPSLLPYQLDNRYLIEATETRTDIIKKYRRQFGNDTITYTFLVPKTEQKINRIPTFGADMRKALLIACAFAEEQKTLSPIFRKQHIFKLQGKAQNKISGQTYANLDNGWKTIAYLTYERENNKKGKEYRRRIGHIIDNVDWIGKGRGSYINPTLNRKYFSSLTSYIERKETHDQFLLIPKDRLTQILSRDEENFLNYIDSLKGMRDSYPTLIKTLFISKLGYQIESLKKMGSGQISEILVKCLDRAKTTGRLKKPYWIYNYRNNAHFNNILNWKIKFFLS